MTTPRSASIAHLPGVAFKGTGVDFASNGRPRSQATARHRAKRWRVEVLLTPGSPEAVELAHLVVKHGSAATVIKMLLRESALGTR